MKILIFLQGTIIMHKNAIGHTREEIIKQVINKEASVRDHGSYIPIGNAVKKLQTWKRQGVDICYLSALTDSKDAREDEIVLFESGLKAEKMVLKRNNFPDSKIYHRKSGEEYRDVIERIKPLHNVLIEDDCESIGKEEMTYPTLNPELKMKIKSIVVKEFDGIDHLPDDINKI